MDRTELRFRILFEYYNELHSEPQERENQADSRVQKIDVPEFEKAAAQVWLVDSGYVNGEVSGSLGSTSPMPFISRINNYGINFVESVMDTAFIKIKDKFEGVEKLSKIERIQRFSKECLNSPVASEMCRITYDAIVEFMNSANG